MATTTTKPRRRWFQFRLRTLIVLMLLVSIGMSWFAMKMQQARRQRAAVNALVESGSVMEWKQRFILLSPNLADPYLFSKKVTPIYSNEPRVHAWLREMLGDDFFAYPVSVNVGSYCRDMRPARLFGTGILRINLTHAQPGVTL
jgi:hypothetical protein